MGVMASTKLKTSDYVHLHNHTQYSLLDGLTKIPALIDAVKEMGMASIAITDHGTMSGAIEFYTTAKENDIKPIIGMETYIAPRQHTDKDPIKDKTPFHLILLAMNNTGYQNLMRLSTIANLNGFYYRPRIDHKLLEKYNEGLIVLSGCIGGEVSDALRQDQYEQAKKTAEWYKSVFGDRYYMEIQDHGHPKHNSMWDEQVKVTEQTFKLAKELDVKCVLTCDAHYLKHSDQEAHEILLCVQTGSFLSDEGRMTLKNLELHVTDPKEIINRWGKDHPEIITNTSAVAKRCDVEISLGKILIPKFALPKTQTEKSYLHDLVYMGLVERYANKNQSNIKLTDAKKILPKEVIERVQYELGVVEQMNYNGYFLIIADFMNWGKAQGIVFGPGRGSAAGSIIAYALKITELDPLKYNLLFERFLNPDRISMPDIDIDIQDNRRDEVIQYCIDKYGADRVANIVTFGRMAARNAVRDVARVLQVPYADADRLAKMIPPPVQGRHVLLATSLQENLDLRKEYKENKQSKQVFDLAVQLEGTIRSHGVHAAGVVIAPDDIVRYTPLEMAQKGVVATQYSMGPIDELGLIKMDFLGLSNLTIIKNTLRIIKKINKKEIDINKIPLDDRETYELLQRGDTTGIFQLESSGMKRYLKELKPTLFEDIVAMVALYRPGPLGTGLTDSFIRRKNGSEDVEYAHPTMKASLESTYGVLVYQEQVMQIARDMCGFTGGQADTLRKAIGKKNRTVMEKMKKDFIKGAEQHSGVSSEFMEKFWKGLEGFADYAFNKSHAACYGMISFQTAYLKAHYPLAFMAALMTSDYDNTDRLAIEINECKNMNIEVLPPDVNESFVEFGVVPLTKELNGIGLDAAQGTTEKRSESYMKYDERAPKVATKRSAKSDSGAGGSTTVQAVTSYPLRIRFGMAAVKNVGTGAVEEILRAREKGPFASLEDFFERVNSRIANRKTMESLIKAGALDRFGDRSVLLNNLDNILAYASRSQKNVLSGQTDLFGSELKADESVKSKIVLSTEGITYPLREQLQWERELLGLYLSQHPLEQFQTILNDKVSPIKSIANSPDGKMVKAGGIITEVREVTTKNGQKMSFVKLADLSDEVEMVVFPSTYDKTAYLWTKDNVVIAKGKISRRGRSGDSTNEASIIVNDVEEISVEKAAAYKPKKNKSINKNSLETKQPSDEPVITASEKLYIRLQNSEDQQMLMKLKGVIDAHNGETEVILVVGDDKNRQIIKLPMKINRDEPSLEELKSLVGIENVKVK